MAFVPNPSTFHSWNGSATGTVNYSANTVTYQGCNGDALENVSATVVLQSIRRDTHYDGGNLVDNYYQTVKVVSNITSDQDISVNLRVYRRYKTPYVTGPITDIDFTIFVSYPFIIPAGTKTSTTNEFPLYLHTDNSPGPYEDQWAIIVDSQTIIPSCGGGGGSCTLTITGSTTSSPTLQGGSDGSIEVYVSGSTGTTMYTLNGGTPQVSSIFTGLVAGDYSILVTEGSCYDSATITINDGEFRTGDFIVTEPSTYVASENPIVITIGTKDNGIGIYSVSKFVFDVGVLNNYRVTFNLTAPSLYSATFWAKDFPNRDNYFTTPTLKSSGGQQVGVNSISEIATAFAEALQKDINIRRWYFIDVTDDTVTLTAKEATSRMDLTQANVDVLNDSGSLATTGITLTQIQAGADAYQGSLVSSYSIYNDIYIGEESVEFGDILSAQSYNNYSTIELPYSLDNIHKFDSSDILKNFVSTPKIDLTFSGFTILPTMIRPFYVTYGEKYPLVANTNTKKKRSKGTTDYKWVINSALNWEDEIIWHNILLVQQDHI